MHGGRIGVKLLTKGFAPLRCGGSGGQGGQRGRVSWVSPSMGTPSKEVIQ